MTGHIYMYLYIRHFVVVIYWLTRFILKNFKNNKIRLSVMYLNNRRKQQYARYEIVKDNIGKK